MKRPFRVAVGDPATLVAAVAARLDTDPATAAAWLARGAIELDGRRARADVAVAPGARVLVFVPAAGAALAPLVVAYQDRDVIVIDKPVGLRVQGVRGDEGDTLVAHVQRELDPAATLLHRLDRETSGLVLLPRSDRARRRLAQALADGRIERRYLALVKGHIEAPRTIELRVGRDRKDARRRVALPPGSDLGEPARTHLLPLEARAEHTLVRLELDTGRTHQLRVHLAAIGHPIVGDPLYGGLPASRLWLHADELVFPDLDGGAPRKVTAPLSIP